MEHRITERIESRSGSRVLRVVLAGNPNSGKSTIFNNLTGRHQRVSNFPGVTVEKHEGEALFRGRHLLLTDLPGFYSLSTFSLEERVSRRVLLDEKPDVVVNVVDSTNLERSLYLTLQLIESGVPVVLALNMSDEARARGIEFDLEKLSALLGVPLVDTVARRGEGMDQLLEAVLRVAEQGPTREPLVVSYGGDLEALLGRIEELVRECGALADRYPARWVAVKLLERDQELLERVANPSLAAAAEEASRKVESLLGDPPEIIMAERRYGFISGACQEAVRRTVEARHNLSDRIDELVLNDMLGIPILLLLLYAVFYLTFALGSGPQHLIEWLFARLGEGVTALWPTGSNSPLRALLVEGVIGGVGGVVVFLPNILLLFLGIALLEDIGYTARAAFITDRLMHRIGLHGNSFIPLLIGFGCSVPAIMATRTLGNRRDRLVTMMIIPLMSCGGRFPIYALIIPAFFADRWQAPMLWMIYVIGVLLAILAAKLLGRALPKRDETPFVMELPPYRIPTVRSVLLHMWEPGREYLRKAGTVIFGASMVLWAIAAFPHKTTFDQDYGALRRQALGQYRQGLEQVAGRLELAPGGARWLEMSLPLARELELREGPSPSPAPPLVERFVERVHQQGRTVGSGGAPADQRLEGAASFYLSEVRQPLEAELERLQRLRSNEQLRHSIAGRIGGALEHLLGPIGFDWKISTALIGGLAAKELFISQMGIIYAVEGGGGGEASSLRERLRQDYTLLSAFCMVLFLLIGTPCVATFAVTRKEAGGWRWALAQWAGLTALAYLVTLVVYQGGRLLGLGG